MEFLLGIITGFLSSLLIVTTLTFFRSKFERAIDITQRKVERVGPHVKGEIYLPEDEGTVARKEIIKKNKEIGRDTPFSELE
jgi:hypothetical protein